MQRGLKKTAGSMISTAARFAAIDVMKVLKKPEEGESSPDRRTEESAVQFSSDRFMLKKRPENRPVRKINVNIRLIFFM